MRWFFKFINSSIGKKLTMAVTGSFLLIFLIIHLIGNVTLFFGPEAFNGYVKALDVIKPLIRVIELVLLQFFFCIFLTVFGFGLKIKEPAELIIRLMVHRKIVMFFPGRCF